LDIIIINERKNKTLNLIVNWSIVLLMFIMIIAILVFFVSGIINFTRTRIDYQRVHQLSRENTIVKGEIEYMESEISKLQNLIESLNKNDTLLKYFSGLAPIDTVVKKHQIELIIQDTTEPNYELSNTLDELLLRVERQYASNKQILEYINKKENLKNSIPSIAPVNGWYIRGFGYYPDPFTNTVRMHEGLDIAAPIGTPIIAPADGIVKAINNTKHLGILIEIKHNQDFSTIYGHCQNPRVRPGQEVKRGDTIAYVGITGKTTGPHLHYEIRISGIPVNPLGYIIIRRASNE